jgi:hypothetical protein
MLKLINKKNNIVLILITIITNYIFFVIPFFELIIKINFILFIFFSIFYLIIYEKNKFLIIFIIALIFINLGLLTESWDARSIWLFKSKQIFFENTILFSKNNYAQFSHPDYPNIAPAFSAALAKLVGHWNEIFPKLGFSLMFIPALILLSKYFDGNKFLILLSLTIFVIGKYFVNGELDGLISVYFVVSALIIHKMNFNQNNIRSDEFLYLGFAVILTLLKLEGLVLLLCLIITSVFYMLVNKKTNYRLMILFFISLLPIIMWNLYCFYYDINNANTNYAYSLEGLLSSIYIFKNFTLITEYLIFNEKFLLSLIFFVFSVSYYREKKLFNFVFLVISLYIGALFIVYLSTPLEIEWHLNSSANRVIKPISLLLFTFGIYNIFNKNIN